MPNMSYCRFQNTFQDLRDCEEHLLSDTLSKSEHDYRKRLIELCKDITQQCYDFDEATGLTPDGEWDEDWVEDIFECPNCGCDVDADGDFCDDICKREFDGDVRCSTCGDWVEEDETDKDGNCETCQKEIEEAKK